MKRIIIVLFFMFIGLLAYGQSARTYNLVKTHCDQINRTDKGLGSYIWGIINYYNPQMVTNLVTREPNTNKRRIGLCQVHEFIVQLNTGKYDPYDLYGSIIMSRDYLQQSVQRGNNFSYALFWLLYGLDSFENMNDVYASWVAEDLPKIRELANEFTGWGF